MKNIIILIILVLAFSVNSYSVENNNGSFVSGHITQHYIENYKELSEKFVGNWQQKGQTFTILQSKYFQKIYFWILVLIPIVFILHYIIIGPKKFSHEGETFLVYKVLTRFIHWVVAASFSMLVFSGLIIIFGKYFGGGNIVRNIRYLHAAAAAVFVPFALIMFIMWVKDMIVASGDIGWFLKFGGYLSKKNTIMNVGRFNPGQKIWFWLAIVGGFVMAYTGYYIFNLNAPIDSLRRFVILHNFLGMALVAMFMVHLYMSVFAIKGSLTSMLSGYKHEAELKSMHCKYYKKLTNKDCSN